MSVVVVEEVVSKYEIDPTGYTKGAKQVQADALMTAKAVDASSVRAKSSFAAVGSTIKDMIGPMSVAKSLLAGIAASAAIGLGLLGAELKGLANASNAAAGFESLVASIAAIEGSSDKARRSIAKLQEIAKAPGIGFEDAVKGYGGFRRAGLDSEFSFRAVTGAGKANAASAGGLQEFGRVILAFEQIANKQYLQGEELLQLMDANINVNKPLKEAYGTADTEELKKKGITSKMVLETLVKAFERLPAVAGGSKNSIDNFMDAVKFGVISFGGAINKNLMPQLDGATKAIEDFTKQGGFASVATDIAESFGRITGGAISFKDVLINGSAAVMTFNSYMEAFATRIKEIGGYLKWIGDHTPSGKIINWVKEHLQGAEGKGLQDTFDSKKAGLMNDLELGRKRAERQEAKDKKQDALDKKKGTSLEPGSPSTILQDIKANTEKTADNTAKQNQISERVLGGGSLSARGLSKEEIGRAGGGGSKHPAVHNALMNLGRAIDQVMSGTTARAFAQQTTRREI